MILLVTNKRDVTTDFIVLELRRRGLAFYRLNSEDLPATAVRFTPNGGWSVETGETSLALSEVTGAYYRRPGVPEVGKGDVAARRYRADEWSAVARSLWNALDNRWLNSPFAIIRAEDKPRQLALAASLGFDLPETLVTNDFERAEKFVASGGVIGKPLRHSVVDRGDTGEVLFTSRIDPLKPEDRGAVELAPVIYQREMRKAHDVRVTVVNDTAFAVAIHSQDSAETEVDWRSGTRQDLRHEPVTLDAVLSRRCIELTRALNLRFGAIDLIADQSGRHWFLEINPNGQWAWLEQRTGLPIAASIVDALQATSG